MKTQIKAIAKHFPVLATVIGIISGGIGIWTYFRPEPVLPDITGVWTITLKPEESTVNDYLDDVYVYEVYVIEKSGEITGIGEQTLYNGNLAKKHFKIEFEAVKFEDGHVVVAYRQMDNRGTEGILRLSYDEEHPEKLSGNYSASVANTKGKAEVSISKN